MNGRIQRRAKGLVVFAASPRPAETAERMVQLIVARLPRGRAREAESFWWFSDETRAISCPNTYGDDIAAAEYLRVLREVSREVPELVFEVGFEPVFLEMMRLQAGSFGEDDAEIDQFLAAPG